MKTVWIYTFCAFLIFNISCNDKKQTAIDTPIVTTQDSAPTHNPEPQNPGIAYVVDAPSGLNYRDAPDGKVLGNFANETTIQVVENTGILHQVNENGVTIAGEWLAVNHQNQKVYVFSAYTYKKPTIPEMPIYSAVPFSKESEYYRGNINVSETYFIKKDKNKSILTADNMVNDDFYFLTTAQRQEFLKVTNISDNDKAYIYDLETNQLHTYAINVLDIFAVPNPYSDSFTNRDEFSFEFCFDLNEKFTGSYDNFVYIGKENPFEVGGIKIMDWKEINNNQMPRKVRAGFNKNINSAQYYEGKSFVYTENKQTYYIQNLHSMDYLDQRLMIVWDPEANEILQQKVFTSNEGRSLRPFRAEEQMDWESNQYTGKLFKDKPDILYGFYAHSFGCAEIMFLDRKQTPIEVLCDNRH